AASILRPWKLPWAPRSAPQRLALMTRRRSSHGDRRINREAERQRDLRIEPLVDDDLHRHTLHDLDEIAGGVFGREGRELRARTELDAVDVPFEAKMRVGIDADFDMLPRPHVGQLALLEIGRD